MFNCIAVLLARAQEKGITFIQAHRNVHSYLSRGLLYKIFSLEKSGKTLICFMHCLATAYFRTSVNRESKKDIFSFVFFELPRLLLVINNYKAPYLQARQPIVTSQRNIAEHNIFRAFGHLVTKCCDMFVTNCAHGLAQHCCTNLVKRLQYHATSTNVA